MFTIIYSFSIKSRASLMCAALALCIINVCVYSYHLRLHMNYSIRGTKLKSPDILLLLYIDKDPGEQHMHVKLMSRLIYLWGTFRAASALSDTSLLSCVGGASETAGSGITDVKREVTQQEWMFSEVNLQLGPWKFDDSLRCVYWMISICWVFYVWHGRTEISQHLKRDCHKAFEEIHGPLRILWN